MTAVDEKRADSMQAKPLAFFRKLPLFANLSDEDVIRFADVSQIKNYRKGHVLYLEGEQADFLYIIRSGWLKLFRATEEGEEIIIAVLDGGSVTGENAIFDQGRNTCSAQVVEDAQILSIPIALLKEQLRVNNQLAFNMLNSMARYQRFHELQMEQYLLYSAPQRIGCFLLGLCPTLEQKDGVMLDLPYDKTLIASSLGMKGATFSRALNILREATGLHIAGTSVTIDSMERLRRFMDGSYSHPRLRED